jgi:hypothetical protein
VCCVLGSVLCRSTGCQILHVQLWWYAACLSQQTEPARCAAGAVYLVNVQCQSAGCRLLHVQFGCMQFCTALLLVALALHPAKLQARCHPACTTAQPVTTVPERRKASWHAVSLSFDSNTCTVHAAVSAPLLSLPLLLHCR